MAEKVTVKRSSTVSFVGISNLPHEKAIQLRDILQNIIAHLSALHATCDDARMKVDDRAKEVKSLAQLQGDLDALVLIGQQQVDVCSGSGPHNSVLQELQGVYSQITSSIADVRSAMQKDGAGGDAYYVVDKLLAIVKLTVDMLRTADRYTVAHVQHLTDELVKLADATVESTSIPMLVERAGPLSRAAVEIARIAEQRAKALDQNNDAAVTRDLLRSSANTVGESIPGLIVSVKERIQGAAHADPLPLKHALTGSLSNIAYATRTSPEFAVIFDVSYLDSVLAMKLQALADAVRGQDRIQTSTAAKAVEKELDRRIALAKKDPKLADTIKAVQAANQQAQAAAREALNVRMANADPMAASYMMADKDMTSKFEALKQAAEKLPDANIARTNSQVPLIQAARALSLQMWSLLHNSPTQ